MRFKLTRELCYMAGLASRTYETERSQVGIMTTNDELAERFVKDAMGLGVDTTKIMINEKDSVKHIYFYHSKISRMLREILKQRTSLPRKGKGFAAAFVAGTFDAGGHIVGDRVTMRRLEKGDELLLELLGIHTVNSKILNIRAFFTLIKDDSVMLKGMHARR